MPIIAKAPKVITARRRAPDWCWEMGALVGIKRYEENIRTRYKMDRYRADRNARQGFIDGACGEYVFGWASGYMPSKPTGGPDTGPNNGPWETKARREWDGNLLLKEKDARLAHRMTPVLLVYVDAPDFGVAGWQWMSQATRDIYRNLNLPSRGYEFPRALLLRWFDGLDPFLGPEVTQ
jgi:hypothetical protein